MRNYAIAILIAMAIQIQLDKSNLQPGESLAGSVHWDFATEPTLLTLEVYWETAGKGTGDSETLLSEEWKPDSKKGDKRFQWPLPRGPISVQGNLVSIRWVVQCTSKRPKESAEVTFILSHLGSYIRLVPAS